MAKNRPIRNSELAKEAQEAKERNQQQEVPLFGRIPRERWPLIILFFTVTIGSFLVWSVFGRKPMLDEYSYELVATYPHDSNSFTQGLIYRNGFLYESSGKYGFSKIRKILMEEGRIVGQKPLENDYFGEGLCEVGDKLIQITWKENKGFVWDHDLNLLDEFEYDFDGWGLTYNGTHLIVSDGTATLRFLDPDTYEVVNEVLVRKGGTRMSGINELEYINGEIFANVYGEDMIYLISPVDGQVTGRINFQGILPMQQRPDRESVMNGIAVHPDKQNTLLVTGKNWPFVYEVQIRKPTPEK